MPEKIEAPVKVEASQAEGAPKPKCKPCCACPETRKARDACVMEHGEEKCQGAIDAHIACMREMGFKV